MTESISTGFPDLDDALGVGGFPRGHATEIYGAEASGKTTLALYAIASAQREGGTGVFIDAEYAFDPIYAASLGVDLDKLLIFQPDSGEDALDSAGLIVENTPVDILVFDSAAALVPRSELAGTIADESMGMQGHMMSSMLRGLMTSAQKKNTCIIFINQIRMKLQAKIGSRQTTPGGRPLTMYASIRVDLKALHRKRGKTSLIRATVVKNRIAPPRRTAEFEL